jgi:MFS family permease
MTAQLSAADPSSGSIERDHEASPMAEVLRDITRGGLAGLLVGIILGGVGGRLVMRLAALLVPAAEGAFTENGNRVGDITIGGTAALIVFIGLFVGVIIGSLWVIIRPWLTANIVGRGLVTVLIALALGTRGLIEARNPDFAILGHDPLVVASLLAYIALFGPALVVTDAWLERVLPHAGPGDTAVWIGFIVVTVLGLLLAAVLMVPLYLGSPLRPAGIALGVVGVATLVSWWRRIRGQPAAPTWLSAVARTALGVAVIAGVWVTLPDVRAAFGLA